MRKIFYALLSTLSAAVLVGSYYFSFQEADAAAAAATTSSTVPVTPMSPAETPTMQASGLRDGTFTGSAVQTRYGAVQVAITVSNGSIIDVQVPAYPSGGGREARINTEAVPQLVSETLQAQSANIDMVSGATYTMTGYLGSLQSAIDQARA